MMDVMETLLWISAGIWVLLLIQVFINILITPRLSSLALKPPEKWPSISIVVPARNEERAIRRGVSSYCEQDYPDLEVVVADDGSTDNTPLILNELNAKYSNLKVVSTKPPEQGWLGKPNALEWGKKQAKGEWLLFADADVVYEKGLLKKAMAFALKEKSQMVFLLPFLETRGLMEAVVLSKLYVVCLLAPLYLIPRSKHPLFSAGGGVFNLVKREALDHAGVFESIKSEVVDDVALGRKIKSKGFKESIALARSLIRIRMYHGGKEAMDGFTKNIYSALKGFFALPFLFGALLCFAPYLGLFFAPLPAGIALFCIHGVHGSVALFFRQPWFVTLIYPLSEITWWVILIRSFVAFHKKGVTWRGRTYKKST